MNGKVTAEFAKLFDFFTKLASGDRRRDVSPDEDDVDNNDYERLTQIYAYVRNAPFRPSSSSSSSSGESNHVPSTTLSVVPRNHPPIPPHTERSTQSQTPASFPLREDPGFTFKMMIHDLYSIGDFANMVKDALAASQEMFKPLAVDIASRSREATPDRDVASDEGSGPSVLEGLGGDKDRDGEEEMGRPAKKRCVEDGTGMGGWGPSSSAPRKVADARESLTIDTVKANEGTRTAIPARMSPMSAAAPIGLGRPRSMSSPKKRVAGQAVRRGSILTPAVESPVVKKAEQWLSSPRRRSWMNTTHPVHVEGLIEEQPEPLMPETAPDTRTSFDLPVVRYTTGLGDTPKRKRRLST